MSSKPDPNPDPKLSPKPDPDPKKKIYNFGSTTLLVTSTKEFKKMMA